MEDRLLNLEEVSHLVALKNGWSEEKRLRVLSEYEEYLDSAATRPKKHSGLNRPTRDVDALWHEHILNTTLYADYCMARFGFYLHHIACIPADYKKTLSTRINREIPAGISDSFDTRQYADCGDEEIRGPEPCPLADCGDEKPLPQPFLLADCGPEDKRRPMELIADCGTGKPVPPRLRQLADCGPGKPIAPEPLLFADCGAPEPKDM